MGAPPRLVVVVGPTASGKTELAIGLAERVDGEVVSADSQQVYRGMDVGTGKATPPERARVPHHLIDVVAPDEPMTAARFVELADAAIADVARRGRAVVVAGGTGLYVRALLFGLFAGPPADPALRATLAAEAAGDGVEALWARLQTIDPEAASRIDRRDLTRITRALEVHELTGVPISVHQRAHDHRRLPPRYPARLVGLAPPLSELDRRIDARVDAMFAAGLLDEVRGLETAGYPCSLRAFSAIGYREVCRHLRGELPLADAVSEVKRASRRYARRQLRWYRPHEGVTWYKSSADVDVGGLAAWLRAQE